MRLARSQPCNQRKFICPEDLAASYILKAEEIPLCDLQGSTGCATSLPCVHRAQRLVGLRVPPREDLKIEGQPSRLFLGSLSVFHPCSEKTGTAVNPHPRAAPVGDTDLPAKGELPGKPELPPALLSSAPPASDRNSTAQSPLETPTRKSDAHVMESSPPPNKICRMPATLKSTYTQMLSQPSKATGLRFSEINT